MRFEAKKDKRLLIPLFILMGFGLLAISLSLVDLFSRPLDNEAFIIIGSLGFFFVVMGLLIQALSSTYYELQEDALFIRFGVIKQTIKYVDITEVKEKRSWLSSLAWTFDRIAIYKNNRLSVLIGPVDKALFLREIKRKITPPSIDF